MILILSAAPDDGLPISQLFPEILCTVKDPNHLNRICALEEEDQVIRESPDSPKEQVR
jgi:hypothetical protein